MERASLPRLCVQRGKEGYMKPKRHQHKSLPIICNKKVSFHQLFSYKSYLSQLQDLHQPSLWAYVPTPKRHSSKINKNAYYSKKTSMQSLASSLLRQENSINDLSFLQTSMSNHDHQNIGEQGKNKTILLNRSKQKQQRKLYPILVSDQFAKLNKKGDKIHIKWGTKQQNQSDSFNILTKHRSLIDDYFTEPKMTFTIL